MTSTVPRRWNDIFEGVWFPKGTILKVYFKGWFVIELMMYPSYNQPHYLSGISCTMELILKYKNA